MRELNVFLGELYYILVWVILWGGIWKLFFKYLNVVVKVYCVILMMLGKDVKNIVYGGCFVI